MHDQIIAKLMSVDGTKSRKMAQIAMEPQGKCDLHSPFPDYYKTFISESENTITKLFKKNDDLPKLSFHL